MPFPPLPSDESLEPEVLRRWDAHGVRARSLAHREDGAAGGPRGVAAGSQRNFVFYEGPPTANGRPAIHHVFSRTLKDVVCRHRLMAGFRVPRKAGWDTQGLPVEIEVQKALGITTREQIESLKATPRESIAEFNRLCRDSVFKYKDDWEKLSLRMGYWLDYEHPYVTCETGYIESVWALLAKFHEKGLLKKDFKILPYCPRCQTGLSNHEVAQGYEDVQDPSVYVRFRVAAVLFRWQLENPRAGPPIEFPLRDEDTVSLLIWTTTPWTLFANVAVAFNPSLDYVLVRHADEYLLIASGRARDVLREGYEELVRIPGQRLEGLMYERPLDQVPIDEAFNATMSRAYGANFVSADDGTGFVHIAPGFGADDFSLRLQKGLPLLKPVDDQGQFTADVGPPFAGRFVKEADKDIIRHLKDRGLLFKQQTVDHAYPHCWRCRSPLLYMARPSWYLLTTKQRDRMVQLNEQIDWHPPEIGTGRFGEWLANNLDWAISRERYWGTPLNVWICDGCGREETPASLAALGKLRGTLLPPDFDPHRPYIDDVTYACGAAPQGKPRCTGVMRRTPEVIDCWFDSGAMPFAQAGWPAATGGKLPADFPAAYISEGLDQTRGWFYTLHAIATCVADQPAYKACLVNNLLLDAAGKKMSKSRGNVVDPQKLFDTVGADAVRWFFLNSGQVWIPKRFDEKALTESARRVFGTLRNCYAFLALYANLDGWTPGAPAPAIAQRPSIDRWLISRLQTLTSEVSAAMDRFDLTEATQVLDAFIDRELSNWYVRRNRARFWKSGDSGDKRAAFATLALALERVALLLAPIAPFLAEWLWGAVTGAAESESVHLQDWPATDAALVDTDLERQMAVVLDAVELGRSVRAAHDLKVRQPLAVARIKARDPADAALLALPELSRLVREELNVRALAVVDRADFRTLSAKADFKRLGPRLGPKMKAVAAAVARLDEAALEAFEGAGTLTLSIDGEALSFDRQDIVLVEQGRPGFAVAGDGRLVLALDTRLDDDLLSEGRAREIVSRVQNTRKAAGLDVSDRVVVRLAGHADLLAAARRHEKLILAEVLGTRLEVLPAVEASAGAAPADVQTFDVDGAPLHVAVTKVATG